MTSWFLWSDFDFFQSNHARRNILGNEARSFLPPTRTRRAEGKRRAAASSVTLSSCGHILAFSSQDPCEQREMFKACRAARVKDTRLVHTCHLSRTFTPSAASFRAQTCWTTGSHSLLLLKGIAATCCPGGEPTPYSRGPAQGHWHLNSYRLPTTCE